MSALPASCFQWKSGHFWTKLCHKERRNIIWRHDVIWFQTLETVAMQGFSLFSEFMRCRGGRWCFWSRRGDYYWKQDWLCSCWSWRDRALQSQSLCVYFHSFSRCLDPGSSSASMLNTSTVLYVGVSFTRNVSKNGLLLFNIVSLNKEQNGSVTHFVPYSAHHHWHNAAKQ